VSETPEELYVAFARTNAVLFSDLEYEFAIKKPEVYCRSSLCPVLEPSVGGLVNVPRQFKHKVTRRDER
jgi:hypothetical protein